MRKTFAIGMVLALAVIVVLASATQSQRVTTGTSWPSALTGNGSTSPDIDAIPAHLNGGNDNHGGGNPLDVVDSALFTDDFEGGHPAWTSVDILANTVMWHPSTYHALGGTGTSWWQGDETTHSYPNHQLQYLILPVVDLSSPSSPQLAFKARWALENPGSEPVGYDMWDAWDVWGSTDGGTTWFVLEPSAPDASPSNPATNYTGASSYAFGVEWGMGPGIPGYATNTFSNTSYTEVVVPLTALAGSANARVRIAFCSDPATPDNADTNFFGLHVDSIRVSNGGVIYSNDGTADGQITFGIGPVSPDVWVYEADSTYGATPGYHSAIHAWNGEQSAYNVARALKSYAVTLPAGYQKLKMTYWVWCDLPDQDGNGDGFLEDYYIIRTSPDGVTWTQAAYDYGYDNGEGNSLLGWVLRTRGLSGGQATIDIPLLTRVNAPNDTTVYVAIEINLDNNDDGGRGTGLHIDDVNFIAQRAQAIDLATRNMIVPLPTTVGIARPWTFVFANEGLNAISPIRGKLRYTKPDGTFLPAAGDSVIIVSGVLNYGNDTTVTRTLTPSMAGGWMFRVIANATGELDRTNDTTYSPPVFPPNPANPDSILGVYVRNAGVYELGYHRRNVVNAFLQERVNHFTPLADGVPAGDAANYDMLELRVMWRFDSQLPAAGAPVLVRFWEEGVDSFHTGPMIYSTTTLIDTNETIGEAGLVRWWKMNLSTIPELHDRTGNFWVSLSESDTNSIGDPMPLPLGGRALTGESGDGHNYFGTPGPGNALTQSTGRLLVDVVIGQAVEDLVIHRGVSPSNDIVLNWPAVTGASKYFVWRLSTPNQLYTSGTLLTPGGIVTNTFTDVDRAAVSSKDFYVVIAEY